MTMSFEELQAENEMLRGELRVTREAADITSDFVVKQFEQTERMLHRVQIANSERQAVLDGATQLSIIATDLDGEIQLFSRGASNLLGYSSDEMVGKTNILSLHLEDEIESYGREISGVVESNITGMAVFGQYVKQKKTRVREWLYTCQDGMLLPVNLSITGLYDPKGRMIGYLFTAMDLTDNKQLEFELTKARDVAESANVSKGEFLARMSHEIRTPMNGIIGMAHMLRKTEINIKQHNYLEKLLSSANTLLRLINDILDFSKIDAGKLVLENITFNLEDVLANVANVIGMQAEEKGLEFLFQVDSQVPCNLDGDPLRLGQVIMNLAGNAVKFTSSGEIVVAVDVESFNGDSVELIFTVKDTGIGFRNEEIAHLFSAFGQADDSITRQYGGTGLGLAICKQLTEIMGGRIWVKSKPGSGSKFIFTAKFGLSATARLAGLARESENVFKGLRALVVDDNSAARGALFSMLSSFKMEVDTVSDGKSAIKRLEEAVIRGTPYDVVLLDWIMPGMDGIETARRIKKNTLLAKVPAMLMVTANGREEAYEEADKVGLDGFLLKPVYGSVIYNTLLQILGIETVAGQLMLEKETENVVELENIRGAQILLVDDNPINRDVGTAFLEDVGMVVEVVANGQECLDALALKSFDLVFMDIQMPEMDGLEATRKIRLDEKYNNLPIIAMTAHAMTGDREKSLAAGMNDHITKPIDPAVLHQTLKLWVAGNKTRVAVESLQVDAPKTLDDNLVDLPHLPGIDQKDALKRLNNKAKLFLRMLVDFQHSFGSLPRLLQELACDGDWQAIKEKVHAVKGVASYVGAISLYNVACELEGSLSDMKLDKAASQLTLFVNALDEVLSSLALLPDQKTTPVKTVSKAAEKKYDYPEIKKEIQKLISLLQGGELSAEEQFRLVEDMLKGFGHDTILSDIARMIDELDFDEAADLGLKLLGKLQENLDE